MKLLKTHIKLIQGQLNKLGHNAGEIDGILGNKTKLALNEIIELPHEWEPQRKAIGFIQFICKKNYIDAGKIDGYWGPQTDFAYDVLSEFLKSGIMPLPWRDHKPLLVNPNNWPSDDETEIVKFYGTVNQNQEKFELPYAHRLSWNKSQIVNSIYCHKKIHSSLNRILIKVLDYYGIEEIRRLGLDLWGGCLNVRKMRGGTNWSTHSWGIAMDYDPENNKLKWSAQKAKFAKPEFNKWWQFWEEEGWTSLGRTKNYDWMHIQATNNLF